jgi:hypothetical protein
MLLILPQFLLCFSFHLSSVDTNGTDREPRDSWTKASIGETSFLVSMLNHAKSADEEKSSLSQDF